MTAALKKNTRFAHLLLLTILIGSPFSMANGANAAAPLPSDWDERMKLGVRAYDRGETRSAFDTFSRLMIDGGQALGASDGRMARLYTNMGEIYSEQHLYKYADSCLKKGLHIAETGYGKNSLQTVPALIDLASMFASQGKDALAKSLFERARAIVDKPGDDNLLPYVVVIEADLGAMFYAGGNYALGEPHFKRALDLASKSFGPTHKWTTTIGGMYATCLHARGKNKEAKAIERAAVAKANETQSPITLWNKQIAAADEAIAGKQFSDAETALKVALQASQELAAEPMLQAITLTKYGQLFVLQNKPAQAIEKWKAAQALADAVLGTDDAAVITHAKQLANLEKSQEQFRAAEPLYTRLVSRANRQFGPESDEYANALGDLAGLYGSWAQYPKAVTYYSKLLVLQEKKQGKDSEKLIPTLVALGTATQNNTKYFSEVNDTAEAHLKRAVDIAAKHFGADSKESADVLDVLSRYYEKRVDWDKAAKTCTQVIAADEKNYGPDSAQTTKALEHYAVVLRAAGWRNQAEPIEARIAKIKGIKTTPEE